MKLILLGILIDEAIRGIRKLIAERNELEWKLNKMEEEFVKKSNPVYVKFDYDKNS